LVQITSLADKVVRFNPGTLFSKRESRAVTVRILPHLWKSSSKAQSIPKASAARPAGNSPSGQPPPEKYSYTRTVGPEDEDMRIIPVIDLLNDQAVHAVKGERQHYKPIQSVLCDTSNSLAVATAFRDQLALKELYIADLNAIQGNARTSHRELVSELARKTGMAIMLDAGATNAREVQSLFDAGVRKVVVGAETLKRLDDLREIAEISDPDRLVFSLDMRYGKVLSHCSELAAMPVSEILAELQSTGWKEAILLDLSRIGTGEGPAIFETQTDLNLLIGGGVSGIEELARLKAMGIEGVLLATALHNGKITGSSLRFLESL
jgi:phosphoribosylformimino-5-aminoimidazole carboxamide ribotide isomerase